VKIYSPKSIIFPESNARGEYDTRGYKFLIEQSYSCTIIYFGRPDSSHGLPKYLMIHSPFCSIYVTCFQYCSQPFLSTRDQSPVLVGFVYAGEGNVKIYSPKSIIFPESNARGEYDTRG
jgi:hypothetical protein